MRRSEKLFNTLVLSGIALATTTALEACSCDSRREGSDALVPSDTGSREGPDVGPPPIDGGLREGVDVGPPVDAALREGPAMLDAPLDDAGTPTDDDTGTP